MSRYKYWVLACCIFLGACDKDYTVDTSTEADYNLLFEYLKKDYAYRDYHSNTMEELRLKYLPLIQANPTNEGLADVILNLRWVDLNDPHFYQIFNLKKYTNLNLSSSLSLDENKPLFQEIDVIDSSHFYTYGTVKNEMDIGYIYINAFNSRVGGSSSLGVEAGVLEINKIVQELNSRQIKSLIVDIRSYAGGSNYIPLYIAQRFANKTAIYMDEYYPVGTSFQKKEWTIEPQGDDGFRNEKIALLSNGRTCSGGEMFLLAMLQRDNLIHIGSRSLGCSGNVTDKDLANGWAIRMTNSRTEYPGGKQYFKVGIEPTIHIENDSTYGVTTFEDQLIKQAVLELK